MKKNLKKILKNVPLLVTIKRFIFKEKGSVGSTNLNILDSFPIFVPYSAGTYQDRASLTIQSVNQIFPFLNLLIRSLTQGELKIENIVDFPKTQDEKKSVARLKSFLDNHGSDKASTHNYHFIYGSILTNSTAITNIFEVGLGTNNPDVVSTMGFEGKPGASLRAFRDFCPNANIFGGDIDTRILFKDDRITTFYVDQTNPSTFEDIETSIPREFDLVIDDGLHSPDANVATLLFGLKIIKKGGWVVIEDILDDAAPLWQVVSSLLPSVAYKSYLFKADGASVFAVQKLE